MQCDPSGCIGDLTIQLGIIMIGKQVFNNFKQIVIPYVFYSENFLPHHYNVSSYIQIHTYPFEMLDETLRSTEIQFIFTGRQHIASYASPVLAIVGMSVRLSVCPSVRHTLALSENDAS